MNNIFEFSQEEDENLASAAKRFFEIARQHAAQGIKDYVIYKHFTLDLMRHPNYNLMLILMVYLCILKWI